LFGLKVEERSMHATVIVLLTYKEEEEEEEVVVVVVFTRENRGGSAQHATRATPTRASHGPMRA
jgi:hypothetical protein